MSGNGGSSGALVRDTTSPSLPGGKRTLAARCQAAGQPSAPTLCNRDALARAVCTIRTAAWIRYSVELGRAEGTGRAVQ